MSFEIRKKHVSTGPGLVEINFLVCSPLEKAGFKNAFSTRHGGVSPCPKDALNLAYRREDESVVDENRRRFFLALGEFKPKIYTQHQVHSDRILMLGPNELPRYSDKPGQEPEGDSIISPQSNIWLGIKTADCLPILIGDPVSKVMAAVHAGWRGTVARVAEKTVKLMVRQQKVDAKNIVAALGPSACGDCYEVGEDVASKIRREFTDSSSYLRPAEEGKYKLDVPMANIRQLLAAGVHPANIHATTYCTIHQNQHFFSHRKEGKSDSVNVGRMLAVIGQAN